MDIQTIDHEAEAFIAQLWRNLDRRMRQILHPHHVQHEPGGKDVLKLPLKSLSDVVITAPTNAQAVIYNSTTGNWVNGTAGGTGLDWHQIYLGLKGTLTATSIPGGPTNRSGKTWTIKTISLYCDTSCTFSIAGNSMSLSAGGGTDLDTGLTATVANNAQLTITCSVMGASGTELRIDIYLEAT